MEKLLFFLSVYLAFTPGHSPSLDFGSNGVRVATEAGTEVVTIEERCFMAHSFTCVQLPFLNSPGPPA